MIHEQPAECVIASDIAHIERRIREASRSDLYIPGSVLAGISHASSVMGIGVTDYDILDAVRACGFNAPAVAGFMLGDLTLRRAINES